jgi:hypothetical protein
MSVSACENNVSVSLLCEQENSSKTVNNAVVIFKFTIWSVILLAAKV